MWANWIILSLAGLIAFGLLCRFILSGPRPDVETGVLWNLIRLHAALLHHLRVEGIEHLPDHRKPGPLIIVANHTAGVDPLLVQSVCRFEIRWMMAQDMRIAALEWFWQIARIIFVDRQSGDMLGAREAIRYVKAGGVLGIFPEGGLERPAETILPFQAGVGLIIRRTGARVLPVVVKGTPIAEQAWESLLRTSHSVITFKPPVEYSGREWTAERIAADLRSRFAAWTGWPLNEVVPWESRAAQ